MIWSQRASRAFHLLAFVLVPLALIFSGCATRPAQTLAAHRSFAFHQDTFAYANELVWEYHQDPESGRMTHRRRDRPPTYSLHCFVVARAARQFFQHAAFDPALPQVDDAAYGRLVRKVVSVSPRKRTAAERRIVIPGFASLYEFCKAKPEILRSHCGTFWESYFQRGHWRMIVPFNGGHQARTAKNLVKSLSEGRPPVIHLVRFPSLSINHAVLIYDCDEDTGKIDFHVYDPNLPDRPGRLTYDRQKRRFELNPTLYFTGGRVDVYQIYHAWNY